jgi:ferrous iron transport protein B
MAGTVASHVRQPLVAVVGNPNAGKTTLFNALTGSNQKVGNYPGVTVERVSATFSIGDQSIELVDIPGLYSLDAVSEDEIVAVNALKGEIEGERRPDLLVCVVNADNLERNLYFFTQLAEAEFPLIVALTMTDVAAQKGLTIDVTKLSNLLGVEVIPVLGHKKKGLAELRDAIERNLADPRLANNEIGFPIAIEAKVATLRERFARSGLDFGKAEIRRALLGSNDELTTQLLEMPELAEAIAEAQQGLEMEDLDLSKQDVASRYQWAAMVQKAVVQQGRGSAPRSFTDKLDYLLTHRVFGLLIFAAIMYGVFQSIYTLAAPLMDLIETAFGWLGERASGPLEGNPILQSAIVDGLINGVGSAIIFLPQIVILFFFISVLEGTGYLARAAFLMDRLLGWAGLSGRAFIPLLSSFACAIPGIMAARVMPDAKSRLATILVAPLMSCSARLPVYVLLIGTFIEPQFGPGWAGFALFAMHVLGLVVAIPIVLMLNKGIIKGKRLPFLLELPPYQWPKWRDVWISMYFRAATFLKTAGTIIVLMSILIWATLYFPRSESANEGYRAEFAQRASFSTYESEEARLEAQEAYVESRQMENSLLGRFGRAIEPVFIPAGFDWRLSTAILSAFPAREVVVSSMGILFSLGQEQDESSTDLREAIGKATWPDGRPLVTPWTAVGLMVFFALCCQCMATLATVKRETGTWKWPVFMFTYMTVLAYVFAVAIHQVGLAVSG